MRVLFSILAVSLVWSVGMENAAAAPRYPWWQTRFGRLTHAHILQVQAAEAAAAAAAAAATTATQQASTITFNTGVLVMANSGNLTINNANAVALEASGVFITRATGTGTVSFVTGATNANVISGSNITIAPLGVTYSGSTNTFNFINLGIVDSTSGTHVTQLNGSGAFTGTLVMSGNSTSIDLTNATGTLTTDSFSGVAYTGSATFSMGSAGAATLTLPDGTVFNLSSTIVSSGN